jgi:hypothetical protein
MLNRKSDYAGWAGEQAGLIRAGRFQDLDFQQLAEELEGIMGNERREIRHRLIVLLTHLLKWRQQPGQRGNSWRSTIVVQRDDIEDLLTDSPSLRRDIPEQIGRAYPKARKYAALETGIPEAEFPRQCPFAEAEIFDPDFWPE